MELSDRLYVTRNFSQQDGIIHLLHVLPGSASLSLHRFAADVRRFEEHLQHEAETRLQNHGRALQHRSFPHQNPRPVR